MLTRLKNILGRLVSTIRKPHYVNECETNIMRLKAKISKIEPYDFKCSQSSDLTLIPLRTPYNSILEYTDILKRINEVLKSEQTLYRRNYEVEEKNIFLNEFFLTKEGNYLSDDIVAVENFKRECLEFLTHYEACEKIRDDEPRVDHNLRVCQAIVMNLFSLVEILSEVKYQT